MANRVWSSCKQGLTEWVTHVWWAIMPNLWLVSHFPHLNTLLTRSKTLYTLYKPTWNMITFTFAFSTTVSELRHLGQWNKKLNKAPNEGVLYCCVSLFKKCTWCVSQDFFICNNPDLYHTVVRSGLIYTTAVHHKAAIGFVQILMQRIAVVGQLRSLHKKCIRPLY